MQSGERVKKLQKLLNELSCDTFLVEDTTNLYYLTGMDVSVGKILVKHDEAYFFVDSRYYEMARKRSPIPVILLEKNAFTDQLDGVSRLGFDSETTSYANFQQLEKMVEKLRGQTELVPAHNPVKDLRCCKSDDEVAVLREAAQLGSEGYDYILTLLKEGVTEAEIAVELEIFWKRKGSKALAFDPIIAFGANSSMPHYRVGDNKLKKGDTVLLDIGVNYRHYHSDMTRVVFFGEPSKEVAAIYDIVLNAQLAALKLCRPGTPIRDLDVVARGVIDTAGYGKMFTHSLGHGVGLEIHESPTIRNKPPYAEATLEEGMVITVEPGIYLQGVGGVRIEDTVVISSNGYEDLTKRSKEIRVIPEH